MGLGLDATDSKILKSCEEDMAKITSPDLPLSFPAIILTCVPFFKLFFNQI